MYLRLTLIVISLLFITCNKLTNHSNELELSTIKNYNLDEMGQVINTEISETDFDPSKNCIECHSEHYDEWNQSMHGYAMKDPVFFSGWKNAQHKYPLTGERFCVQCHSPVAFVSGKDLSNYSSLDEFLSSDLIDPIKEGIGCDVCHTMTALSQTVHTDDNLAAVAKYHLYPGEQIKFGGLQNPKPNPYHLSEYNPIFKRSDLCLPCHDFTIRGVEAEITFTEWNRIPGLAMSGALSCQDCHMPEKEDGTHDHKFVGVDIDLSFPAGTSPLHYEVSKMLKTAIDIKFGNNKQLLPDSIHHNESIIIPITVISRTAHGMPSGTSFAREAWAELVVKNENGDIVYESGVYGSKERLDYHDKDLLFFTTFILDQYGDTLKSIINTHSMIDRSLPAFASRYHEYRLNTIENVHSFIIIDLRMLFRSFKPYMLDEHPELLDNLPIFEMSSISDTIFFID